MGNQQNGNGTWATIRMVLLIFGIVLTFSASSVGAVFWGYHLYEKSTCYTDKKVEMLSVQVKELNGQMKTLSWEIRELRLVLATQKEAANDG